MPSTVTWFSAMASSSADWVFGEARLSSSPSTIEANTGPGRNSNTSADRFQTVTPTTSEGSRSGVNWMRPNSHSTEAARAFARVVLPTPGTSSSRRWPSETRQSTASSTMSDLPRMARPTAAVMVPNSSANVAERGSVSWVVTRCSSRRRVGTGWPPVR